MMDTLGGNFWNRRSRKKWTVYSAVLAAALIIGVVVTLSVTLSGSNQPAEAAPIPAIETVPFIDALNALAIEPEVHYQGSVPDVGTVDVEVTDFGQIIGSVDNNGEAFNVLEVGGKLYARTSVSSFFGLISQQEISALKGKWLTGSSIQSLLGSISSQLTPPAQLAMEFRSALGNSAVLKQSSEISGVSGVSVVGADTSLGVLYVSANPPYRVVSLSPKVVHSGSALPSGENNLTAYTESAGEDLTFPVDTPGGIANTDQELENQTRQLATDAVDLDLSFTVSGNGAVHCSDAGCQVTVSVANSIKANGADTSITGGTVDASLQATITIAGESAGGCTGEGVLPLGGLGTLSCEDAGAGAVFASVEEEKKAAAEAQSEAEGGAEVPYQINYGGEYYVYARAQIDVAELEQQLTAEAKDEGALQHAYSAILGAMQRARNRTLSEVRASLTPAQLAAGREKPWLRAVFFGSSIENAVAADPAVANNPDITHLGTSAPGSSVADFKIRVGGKTILLDVTGSSRTAIASHLTRPYIENGNQLLLYPSATASFLAELFR